MFVGVVVPGREAPLDVEADLHVGQKDVVPQRVDAGDDVAIVAAVGDVGPAAELLGSIGPEAQAGHHGTRVPRVIVRRVVHPRAEDDVPAVIGVREVDLVQLRIQRGRPPADRAASNSCSSDCDRSGPGRDRRRSASARRGARPPLGRSSRATSRPAPRLLQLEHGDLRHDGDSHLVVCAVVE